MKYAKLENDYPVYSPKRMIIGDSWVYNPTAEQLAEFGYLPVVESESPETDEQHFATPHWAIQNNQIVQSWTVEEVPISEEEALTRYANSITGANDPDLLSAAETLIKQRMEES